MEGEFFEQQQFDNFVEEQEIVNQIEEVEEVKECWWIQLTSFIREEDNTYDIQKVLLFIFTIIVILLILLIVIRMIKKIIRKNNSDRWIQHVASSRQHSMISPSNSVHLNSQSLKSNKSISLTSRSVSVQSMPIVRSSSNLSFSNFQNTEIQEFENNLQQSQCMSIGDLSKSIKEMYGVDDDKDD